MTDTTGATNSRMSVSDVVRAYATTHGKMYRMIRAGVIPAESITQEKYKGRRGWRHLITTDAVAALNLPLRVVVTTEAIETHTSVTGAVGFPSIAIGTPM